MTWYYVPVIQNAGGGWSPASGGAEQSLPAGGWFHVDDSGAPTNGLVGAPSPLPSVPTGWTLRTLAEAQADFQTLFGRAPVADEVA